MLRDADVRWCNNCLKCYRNLEAELAPCAIDDGVTGILERMLEADGLIFASPVHNGFLTGRMTAFFERVVWRVCRPTGAIAGLHGMPEPRSRKVRAMATIVSAGGMPARLRKLCDGGTPFLKENGGMFFNATCVGDLYAHAVLTRRPASDADWQRIYDLRRLSEAQLRAAFDLGVRLARTIEAGNLRAPRMMGPVTEALARMWVGMGQLYEVLGPPAAGPEPAVGPEPPAAGAPPARNPEDRP
jgi:hypothetical protein